MKLYFSPASPYVRKVMVCAHEKGVADRIEKLPSAASPITRDKTIVRANPSGKVPTAIVEDGTQLFDSRVICAYVDEMSEAAPLISAEKAARFRALTLEALADSMLDAALLCRYETVMRPKELHWPEWYAGQMEKIDSGLDDLEANWRTELDAAPSIGSIAAACALGYLDFRFPGKDWRSGHPGLAEWFAGFEERPSMQETKPQG